MIQINIRIVVRSSLALREIGQGHANDYGTCDLITIKLNSAKGPSH